MSHELVHDFALSRERDINQLNAFLRGELAAVESYEHCLESLSLPEKALDSLRVLAASHDQRADALRIEVERLGGQAAESSGAWGAVASIAERAASALSEKLGLTTLLEGEEHGRRSYLAHLDELTPATRELVCARVLSAQLDTADRLARLIDQLDALEEV